MHTEALRTIERMRRVDASTISYESTTRDGHIFTAPRPEVFVMQARPECEKVGLNELACAGRSRYPGSCCESSRQPPPLQCPDASGWH
jgi:hypothetical protein